MKLKPTLNQRFCKFHLNLISLVNLGMGKIGKMGGVDSTCHDSEEVVLQQRNQSIRSHDASETDHKYILTLYIYSRTVQVQGKAHFISVTFLLLKKLNHFLIIIISLIIFKCIYFFI